MKLWVPLFFSFLVFSSCSQPTNILPYPLTITEEGVGAIHPSQPYDFNILRSSLPGIECIRLHSVSSADQRQIILLKRGTENLAQLLIASDQKNIQEIVILSSQIKNKDRRGIGETLASRTTLHCTKSICRYNDEPSLEYKLDPLTHRILEISYRKL